MRRLPPRPLPLMIAVFVGAAIVWTPVFSLATSPPKAETPPESSLSPNPMISGVEISLEWNRGFPGLKMGENGLVVADIDGDGFDEIVVAASDDYYYHDSNSYWYVLKWDGGDYSQHFTSIPAKYEIGRIAVGQLDGDAALEIVLVEDHHVVAYDGATFEVEMAHPVLIAAPSGMDLGDVDGDGVIEAVMCNFGRYIIMDLGDGVLQTVEDRGCSDLAVGEVDGSPGLEVVIADGNSPGLVLDPMTNQIEWEHPPALPSKMSMVTPWMRSLSEPWPGSRLGMEIAGIFCGRRPGDPRVQIPWQFRTSTAMTCPRSSSTISIVKKLLC